MSAPAAEKLSNRFIDPQVLLRIQNMELVARTVVEGFVQGLHKSPYLGFSVDFAAYRPYFPGDEIKRIDWNVYGRADKLFIKLFEGETNTKVLVLLDVSGSMKYASKGITKLDYGRMLAACLSYFAFHQRDAVGLLTFDTEVVKYIPSSRRRGQLITILSEIERIVASKETEFKKPLQYLAEMLSRRGLIVVISDFYDEPENIVNGLKILKTKGNDVVAFHILDNHELTFPFAEMAQFEDLETDRKMHVIPEYLRNQYLKILHEHIDRLKKELTGARIDYQLMNTSEPLDSGLFKYLAARSSTVGH
jgi:uncharacterized protein (DUF58 family)